MGLFSRLFKKRSSSQPVDKNEPPKLTQKNSSLPNLIKTTDSNLKSLGQVSTEPIGSDDERTNASSSLKTRSKNNTTLLDTNTSKLRSTTGYESSSDSGDDKKSKDSLDFLNTLTGTGNLTNRENEPDSKSTTSISSRSTIQKKSSLKKDTSEKSLTLADRIKESNLQRKKISHNTTDTLIKTNSSANQVTFREPESEIIKNVESDKKVKEILAENVHLKQRIELLEKQALEREEKFKKENDALIIRLHENLSKGMKSEAEKQELIKVLVSKQQERNEKLINEQNKLIYNLENDLKMLKNFPNADVLKAQIDHLEQENINLKKFIHRQNVELDFFYKNQRQIKDSELNSKLKEDKSKWKQPISQLSPLFLIYDQQLKEKDDSIKLMRMKINEITEQFNQLIDENQNLQDRLDNMPNSIKNQMVQIKSQAELVLEENKYLTEKLSLEEKKVYDSEKFKIEEISRLSKRILVCETERIDLINQIDLLESNNAELVKKYNDASIEIQRRIKIDDHLTQMGDLKRKMEELNLNHKQETELLIVKIQAFENDKKNYVIKVADLEAEINRLRAENKVLDDALSKGIGLKAQKKLQELKKSLDMSRSNEKKLLARLEQLEKETEKLIFERGMIENLFQISETNMKEKDKRIEELIAKSSRLEEMYQEYKEKASLKLASVLEKLKRKDSEVTSLKIDNEKKVNKILRSLSKKEHLNNHHQTLISHRDTSFDNKKLKEVLLELKS